MKILACIFSLLLTYGYSFQKSCEMPSSLTPYLELTEKYPSLFEYMGSSEEGEIELITDPDTVYSICKNTKKKLIQKMLPIWWANPGIIAEDQYLYFIRDAVRFPSGFEGTYDRIVWKANKNNTPGVAVLIHLPDNTFALNVNFRHATRAWELEIPRGLSNKNETLSETAKREAMEETGYQIDEPVFLGLMNPDSGILSSSVAVFYAKASKITCSSQEKTEAIAKIQAFSKEKIKNLLNNGYYTTSIHQKEKKIFVRDSFLTYALYMAEIKKLF